MNWWSHFLLTLSKANQEQFAGKPPNCCPSNLAKPQQSSSEQIDNHGSPENNK